MTDENSTNTSDQSNLKTIGLLARFEGPHELIEACDQVRQAGYTKFDAYSPFPVHGIDEAIGIRRSRLPFLVLAIALSGCGLGLGMQWYMNASPAFDGIFSGYPFLISGKPVFSMPANIPVTFEVIVLSSAFATLLGMLALNKLPRLSNPLFKCEGFDRVTNDGFFLGIEVDDAKYDESETRSQLESWGATHLQLCQQDLSDAAMPTIFRPILVCLLVLALVPPAMILKARGTTNPLPRMHVVPDMDRQDKFKAQTLGPVREDGQFMFADGRVMRQPVPGTVARGDLMDNIEYYRGIQSGSGTSDLARSRNAGATNMVFVSTQDGTTQDNTTQDNTTQDNTTQDNTAQDETPDATTEESSPQETPSTDTAPQESAPAGNGDADAEKTADPPDADAGADAGAGAQEEDEPDWVTQFPLEVTPELMSRGQQRFNIYCTACHGYAGNGDGLVNQRGLDLALQGKATWVQAKSLHDKTVVSQPIGRIFDTISNGRGGMGPYASQIKTEDRWAIVLYVKALQKSQSASAADVPSNVTIPDKIPQVSSN